VTNAVVPTLGLTARRGTPLSTTSSVGDRVAALFDSPVVGLVARVRIQGGVSTMGTWLLGTSSVLVTDCGFSVMETWKDTWSPRPDSFRVAGGALPSGARAFVSGQPECRAGAEAVVMLARIGVHTYLASQDLAFLPAGQDRTDAMASFYEYLAAGGDL
jgi:hypothetical protein